MRVAEVAEALEISTSGVYKLIARGRLPAIHIHKRGLLVSRLAFDAYQRRLRDGGPSIPPIKYSNKSLDELRTEFEADAGMGPVEWERRWSTEEIEDSAENMGLAVRAIGLLLYEEHNRSHGDGAQAELAPECD
jgi:excisionase family DNA binding protein